MCPACMAAAAITAAKIASAGGLGAYGLKKLLDRSKPKELDHGRHALSPDHPGDQNETTKNRIR